MQAAALSLEALFAPKAELWSRSTAHDETSRQTLDHRPWQELLTRYRVIGGDGIARFAYGRVTTEDRGRLAYGRVTTEDRGRLASYLARLEAVPVSALTRAEQFAYWINLYNALTVRTVLDHYPVESIRDIDLSPGLFARGPWDAPLAVVEGERISLNDIEHRILRPIWRDPRIHYAVNCASLGCPDLHAEPFTADNQERLLAAAAAAYVNHPRGVTLDGQQLRVSSIYVWFADDFGGSAASVIDHLRRYAAPDLRERLSVDRIAGHAYDWSLNDAGDR